MKPRSRERGPGWLCRLALQGLCPRDIETTFHFDVVPTETQSEVVPGMPCVTFDEWDTGVRIP